MIELRTDRIGNKFWYKAGTMIRHRLDGPAIEYTNGSKEWWFNNRRHRLDGPAIEYSHSTEYWLHGLLHRVDGPASINGSLQEWYLFNKRHRINGPAVEYASTPQRNSYYLKGYRLINKQEYEEALRTWDPQWTVHIPL